MALQKDRVTMHQIHGKVKVQVLGVRAKVLRLCVRKLCSPLMPMQSGRVCSLAEKRNVIKID